MIEIIIERIILHFEWIVLKFLLLTSKIVLKWLTNMKFNSKHEFMWFMPIFSTPKGLTNVR